MAIEPINIEDLLQEQEDKRNKLIEDAKKRKAAADAAKKAKYATLQQEADVKNSLNRIDQLSEGIKRILRDIDQTKRNYPAGSPAENRLVQELTRVVDAYNKEVAVYNKLPGVPTTTATSTTKPVQGPGLGGRDQVKPTGTSVIPGVGTAVTTQPTGTAKPTGPAGGVGTSTTPVTNTPKTPAEADAKKNKINNWSESPDITKLGINRTVVKYMKENYPQDWEKIKAQIDNALQDKLLTDAEINRISIEFKKTDYYRKAAIEKNRTTIGAYFIENGLDTVSNSALVDKLTNDVYVKGINTKEQAFAEVRKLAVERLGLMNSPDENKRKIGAAMLNGGQSFLTAANPYITAYATALDIPVNEFDPFADNSFLDAFKSSGSFADFQIKVKNDPRYIMSGKGRQEMDFSKLRLQQLTRALGLGYNPQQLEQQAQSIVSGKTTFEQLEYNLRSIAGEAFPAFKDRILAGENIDQIAAPYIRSMTSILEIPDSAIDLSNPSSEIRKALIGDGKTFKPLWQFEQELFKDARWQFTSNARDTVDRVSTDILQRFGMMG